MYFGISAFIYFPTTKRNEMQKELPCYDSSGSTVSVFDTPKKKTYHLAATLRFPPLWEKINLYCNMMKFFSLQNHTNNKCRFS